MRTLIKKITYFGWTTTFTVLLVTLPREIAICNYYLYKYIYFQLQCCGNEMKWNESGFRPPLCTYRLNWARRTSWGWWDDWDDTVLQTQDLKFEPWRSEAEHATSRSRRLPTILTFTRGWGRNNFCFFQSAETGNRTPDSGVKGSGANHYPRAPALQCCGVYNYTSFEEHTDWNKDLPGVEYPMTCCKDVTRSYFPKNMNDLNFTVIAQCMSGNDTTLLHSEVKYIMDNWD